MVVEVNSLACPSQLGIRGSHLATLAKLIECGKQLGLQD